jgi:Divergent InlB B-repeat domain/FlgD Ig-like domain
MSYLRHQLTKFFFLGLLIIGMVGPAMAAIGDPVYKVVTQFGVITKTVDSSGTTTVTNATSLEVQAGTTIYIKADPAPTGLTFDMWYTTSPLSFNKLNESTSFIMPAQDIQVETTYRKFRLKVDSAAGGEEREYSAGDIVTAYATDPSPNSLNIGFYQWQFVPSFEPTSGQWTIIRVSSRGVTFTMPPADANILAVYDYYRTLTVVSGFGSGNFVQNTRVPINAEASGSTRTFNGWVSNIPGVQFDNANSTSTFVRIPSQNITVTATYRTDPVNPAPTLYTVAVADGLIELASLSGTTTTIHANQAQLEAGTTVYLSANPPPQGLTFDTWLSTPSLTFKNINGYTAFIMPTDDVLLQASYRKFRLKVDSAAGGEERLYSAGEIVTAFASDPNPNPANLGFLTWLYIPSYNNASGTWTKIQVSSRGVSFVMPPYDTNILATYDRYRTLTIVDGFQSGSYVQGSIVPIAAETPDATHAFDRWTSSVPVQINSVTSPSTFLRMPSQNTVITAVFRDVTLSTPVYHLRLVNGLLAAPNVREGDFPAGSTISIFADPAPSGQEFSEWVANTPLTIFMASAPATTIIMPPAAAVIMATYKNMGSAPGPGTGDGFTDFDNSLRPATGGTIDIRYYLTNPSSISLVIYDTRGYKVRTLNAPNVPASYNVAEWNGTNDDGDVVATDVYLVVMKVNGSLYKTKVAIIN